MSRKIIIALIGAAVVMAVRPSMPDAVKIHKVM